MDARSTVNKLDEFEEHASRVFAFLRDQHGFVLDRSGSEGIESYLRFNRQDMVVTVNYQLGDEPWVTLSFPDSGQRTSLQKLARDSDLPRQVKAKPATLREHLEYDAALLRAYLEAYRPTPPAR